MSFILFLAVLESSAGPGMAQVTGYTTPLVALRLLTLAGGPRSGAPTRPALHLGDRGVGGQAGQTQHRRAQRAPALRLAAM